MMVGQRAAIMLQDGSVLVGYLRSVDVTEVEVTTGMRAQREWIPGPMSLVIDDAIRIMPAYGNHVPTLIPESPWFGRTAGDTEAGEIP